MDKERKLLDSEERFLADFYREYRNYLFYTARKFSESQEECEDVIQDVMVRLMRNVENVRRLSGNQAATYLYLTVRSVFADRYRQSREQAVPDEVLETAAADRTEDGLNAVWDAAILKEQMESRDWRLLELKYIGGYSDREIAGEMECRPESVRTLVSRARKRAKAILTGAKITGKGGKSHA